MSWFDASGFANIAKSALKGAQRTIDKALDIRENDPNTTAPANTPIDTNSDDFFGTWGVTQSGHVKDLKKDVPTLWGSFTGSFFEASEPKASSIESLDDSTDAGSEHFARSKLVVQQSDDGESHYSRLSSVETDEDTLIEPIMSSTETVVDLSDVKRRASGASTSVLNRLSVVSNESGKTSSESVELITCSTECTTSPESELVSGELSISAPPTSGSVEILEDITSPSSIESSAGTDDRIDFASPLVSPLVEEPPRIPSEKSTPDSVEVILDDQEGSVGDDTMSYNSMSESTSTTVLDQAFIHLKPMLKDTFDPNIEVSITPEKQAFGDAIKRAPSRTGMHLPLTQVNQILIDTQPQSTRQELSNILQNTNIIDIPKEENHESCDEGSQSDRTIIAGDGAMDSSSDNSTSDTANSVYLKTLLADAMTEKASDDKGPESGLLHKLVQSPASEILDTGTQLDFPQRENSPVSSESRSDLVKIGSDHTSGHTSGDELETTTSSDIEIISSPNGDSSSTQSRQSPAKHPLHKQKPETVKDILCKITLKKAKGHTRELSGASSISDDSHSSEADRLIRRISEMTEILESRESKLVDVSRRNAELQEINSELRQQLDQVVRKQLQAADLSQVTEEYTQRLSALEKKFQQAIRDKDTLRKQLEHNKLEAATRISKNELEDLIAEKEDIIKELRDEGEKLSKQQLQHSNIIKKLRVKEKENEATMKNFKETIEDLSTEAERLKRSLTAKEDVERSQIEAIHQLTAKNKRTDGEVSKLQSQNDDLGQKLETVKKSLDAAKKELIDKTRTSSELIAREHKLETLENEKKMTESQNVAIITELEELRNKMRAVDVECQKKEQYLRKENNDMLRRLQEAESRNEELSQSVLEVSKPLVRQLESLQATHSHKVQSFERNEQSLTLKINELQGKLQLAVNNERLVKDECIGLKSKFSDLEVQLGSLRHQNDMISMKLEQQATEQQIAEQDHNRHVLRLQEQLKQETKTSEELSREISVLREQLVQEKERKKSTSQEPANLGRNSPRTSSNSPTLSLGKVSVADSFGSSFWSQDEPLELGTSGRFTNMFEMQMLQTNLKQRDGEVQQLQWELTRREQERALLNKEISSLLTRVEELENTGRDYDVIKGQHGELQKQYDTLCQLLGEKVEENEELKLDLEDVKDMYKSQIDELLKQHKQNM